MTMRKTKSSTKPEERKRKQTTAEAKRRITEKAEVGTEEERDNRSGTRAGRTQKISS